MDGLVEMMCGGDNEWELAEQMIEWLADSWVMDGKWVGNANGLYRWRSQCGANIDMDCTVIG